MTMFASGEADQGFTKAKVLVLCPFRSTCYDFVKMLLAMVPGKKQVANLQRFDEDYGPGDDENSMADKAVDYQHLFAGNSDDRFRIGITFWKKGIRLYAPFDKADILVCSPLGLRQITGVEGDRKREFDFLSSIEVCVVDRADVLRMQNWEHVQEVMQVVNRKPQGLGSIDIARLRSAYAEGRAREFRQTVVTSYGQCLDADALFNLSSNPPAGQGPALAGKGRSLASRLRAPQLGRSKRGGRSLDLDEEEEDIDAGMSLDMMQSMSKSAASERRGATASGRGLAKLELRKLREEEEEFLHQEIHVGGCYEPLCDIGEKEALVVDAGANVGIFAAWALKRWPRCHLLCVEPLPPLLTRLRGSLKEVGGSTRAAVVAAALGSEESQSATFRYFPWAPGESTRNVDVEGDEDGKLKAAEAVLLGLQEDDWQRIRQVVMEVHDLDGSTLAELGFYVGRAAPPAGEPLRQAIAFGISKQFFLHTPCNSLAEHSDRLFETFEKRYWKPLGSTLDALLIVATTYYNFLRLRRYFREEAASFSSIFEYSSNQDLSRARFRFFHGERKALLVTERFLWYRRYKMRGANYVLFYGVPETPEIYEEVLGAVRTPSQCNAMCLFTKQDAFALERIVGQERAKTMLTSPAGKVFVYS
eukprot:s3338_g6.t2